jgi:hypothetical protein
VANLPHTHNAAASVFATPFDAQPPPPPLLGCTGATDRRPPERNAKRCDSGSGRVKLSLHTVPAATEVDGPHRSERPECRSTGRHGTMRTASCQTPGSARLTLPSTARNVTITRRLRFVPWSRARARARPSALVTNARACADRVAAGCCACHRKKRLNSLCQP